MTKDKPKNTQERYLVKPVNGKDADAVALFAVDAKEAVASGSHVYVGTHAPGSADWLPTSERTQTQTPQVKVADEPLHDPNEEEKEEDEVTAKEIKSMNTAELESYVEKHEIKIEGFAELNLKDKRKALADYIGE